MIKTLTPLPRTNTSPYLRQRRKVKQWRWLRYAGVLQ
jgi:hypothetical protein